MRSVSLNGEIFTGEERSETKKIQKFLREFLILMRERNARKKVLWEFLVTENDCNNCNIAIIL